ncbi:Mobile element protein [Pseudomonas orientalis]|nr:Mobile element protein [Pseudomonas orientalis]AZE92317.1 Mobile element protein [Pseudomonas orientalis]AZE92453.1 Mobile element protein [Pseudomonas orientalis]AZE94503.1 Mobile element protein [Pseudomonas orientalis]AZE97795.1 Mobile element protein [Pseudomonas orientalis]
MPGQAFPKHAIKRVDRLLGNQHLRAERPLFYLVILRALLGSVKHPLILVDWSRIDAPGDAFLLRAAIPLAGRSFPIYESVHEREGCPKYQNRLLKTLAELLPDGCVPVMVTDAGFRRPWMKAVAARGWYYVARIRNRELYRREEGEWLPVKNLYALATSSPKSLGRVEMTRSAPHLIDLYCVRHSAKGRKHQRVTGSIAKSKLSRQSARREREPWLLASNLKQDEWNPAKVVAIYKRRMQIEEGFRDVKSEHFGLGLNLHRSHCPKRIEVLLLIAALANYLLFLTGLQARESGLERRYQSNSIKEKRVLSLWRLGLEYWRSCTDFGGRGHLEILERALHDEVLHQAQSLG